MEREWALDVDVVFIAMPQLEVGQLAPLVSLVATRDQNHLKSAPDYFELFG